jgi:hypothetical protein
MYLLLPLARAAVMLKAGLNEDAGRSAWMASFPVAKAYIFGRTGKAAKFAQELAS